MSNLEDVAHQHIAIHEEFEVDSGVGEDDVQTGPNDEKAMDHLDLGHHVFNMILGGKTHLAPIGDNLEGSQILDVGTGTGIWAIEFADQHPNATVIGTDLSPIQPTWIPPNCSFEISDCTDDWQFREESFDFIHVRGLYGSVSDWASLFQSVYKHLKPGAYIEQVEQSVVPKSDDGTTNGTIFERWGTTSLEAGDKFGKTLRICDESAEYMRKAGLVNVVEKRFKVPIGPWAKDKSMKELGQYNRLQWEEGIEGWSMYILTTVMGWQRSEVELYLLEVRKGLADRTIHAYQEFTFVYGQKPSSTYKNKSYNEI